MPRCCKQAEQTLRTQANLTVALAGNPNCGKTTIFNALTGLRQRVANYPGVTVEKKTGRCTLDDGTTVDLIDLPGTYSLISRSPDETVAMEVLRGLREGLVPDAVIVVVDASNLQRNLYLVSQMIELGRPMVVALNMMDIAQRRGLHISPERLQNLLGVPVVAVVGHKRDGIDELKNAIRQAKVAPMPAWELPAIMQSELQNLGDALAVHVKEDTECSMTCSQGVRIAERLLIGDFAGDIIDIAEQQPVDSLLRQSLRRLEEAGVDPMQADIEAHYKWIETVAAGALSPACEILTTSGTGASPVGSPLVRQEPQTHARDGRATGVLSYEPRHQTFTDKLDSVLIHKIWGLVIFALVMAGLFVSIFIVADPLMGATESLVGWIGEFVARFLPAEGALHDLWMDGIVAGVGGVVVFVPQIAILFLFLSILEDSGYLARAAFLMDRALSKVGLHGKSFIPLLSSHACAIPGILATRTIENRKDRLATIFVAPFMSCSARLPVYTLLIGAFFATKSPAFQGGVMFSCYALGILAAVITAWIFKRSLLKGAPTAFILELPTYKLPQVSAVLRHVLVNTWEFIRRAGTIIFCLSVILWAMMYYPRLPEDRIAAVQQAYSEKITDENARRVEEKARELASEQVENRGELFVAQPERDLAREFLTEQAVAAEQLRHSIAGRFGHLIEPVIKPLGYDWKMGVGLVGAFAAREVFVSTMGIVYSVGDDDEETEPLREQMLADRYPDGKPVWSPLVAVSLLIWFVLAMQCVSTVAIVKRETGKWSWAIGQLLYMNGLAYLLCLAVYQIGRHFSG